MSIPIKKKKEKKCSELTIKTLEWWYWGCSVAFIVNIEYVSHLVLGFLLLTLKK